MCTDDTAGTFLTIVLPIILTCIFSAIAWIVQKIYESCHTKKELKRESYQIKLGIVWELHLLLTNHRVLYNKYSAIREGRMSVDSSPSESDILTQIVKTRSSPSPPEVHITTNELVQQLIAKSESVAESTLEIAPDIERRGIQMLATGIQQHAAYVRMGRIYDEQILQNLITLKTLVMTKISIIEPDQQLSHDLVDLLKFIYLYESLRKVDSTSIPNKEQGAAFPEGIYSNIEQLLSRTRNELMRLTR